MVQQSQQECNKTDSAMQECHSQFHQDLQISSKKVSLSDK